MFTWADQEVRVVGVASVARVGVAITHASASNGNILNTVEVLERQNDKIWIQIIFHPFTFILLWWLIIVCTWDCTIHVYCSLYITETLKPSIIICMLTQTKLNYLPSLFGNSEYKTMLVRLHRSIPTLRVTVGSCRATAIRWPSNVLVRSSLSRTLVALVHCWSLLAYVKFWALGRLLTRETTIYRPKQCM